jgi:hypothetical protein
MKDQPYDAVEGALIKLAEAQVGFMCVCVCV